MLRLARHGNIRAMNGILAIMKGWKRTGNLLSLNGLGLGRHGFIMAIIKGRSYIAGLGTDRGIFCLQLNTSVAMALCLAASKGTRVLKCLVWSRAYAFDL